MLQELLLSVRELVFRFAEPFFSARWAGSLVMLKSAELDFLGQLAGTCERLYMLPWHFDVNYVYQLVGETSLHVEFEVDRAWHGKQVDLEHLAKLSLELLIERLPLSLRDQLAIDEKFGVELALLDIFAPRPNLSWQRCVIVLFLRDLLGDECKTELGLASNLSLVDLQMGGVHGVHLGRAKLGNLRPCVVQSLGLLLDFIFLLSKASLNILESLIKELQILSVPERPASLLPNLRQ